MKNSLKLFTGNNVDGDYRYPGSRPFNDTVVDRCLFFGRDKETQLLLNKTLNWGLVVLYAKSGSGKTSLINAGLCQEFRDMGYVPIVVRMNNQDKEPLETFYQGIKDFAVQKNFDYEHGEEDSLWQFFRTTYFWKSVDSRLKPVLILDQFEEFFISYSRKERETFIQNLADLVNNTVPKELLASIPLRQKLPYNLDAPGIKIIISIREDFLGQLEEMSRYIPAILSNRFRLMPLTREQASEAIIKPAQKQHEAIQADSFKFADDSVKMMLDFLCKKKEKYDFSTADEVEPFYLQILCHYVEDKVREKYRKMDGDNEIVIGKEDLGGGKGMQKILQQYYEDQLMKLNSLAKRKRARRLFEKGLINTYDRRLSLEEGEIKRKCRVSESLLKELIHIRLLRSEPRVGSLYYELSHDIMVDPIRKSQKKRKIKRWAKIGSGFLLMIIISWIFGIMDYWIAPVNQINKLYEEAGELKTKGKYTEAEERYDRILKIDKTYINAYLEKGQIFYNENAYDKAIENYNDAINIGIKNDQIYYSLGKALKAKGKCEEAIKKYSQSLNINPNLAQAYEGIGDAYECMKNFAYAVDSFEKALEFDKKKPDVYIKLSIAYMNKGELNKAANQYQRALDVSPEYAYIYEEIAEELRLRGEDVLVEKIYDLASRSDSNVASFYANLGYGYSKLKKYEKAVKSYEKAINIDPKRAYNYNNLGVVFSEEGKYDEAMEAFKRATELSSDYADAYYNIGLTFLHFEKYYEALDSFGTAIKIKDNANAYNLMGYIFVKMKKYEDAIKSYQKAIEIDPQNSTYELNLIEAYFLSKDFNNTFILSNEFLKNGNMISEENNLVLRFFSISALLFQKKYQESLRPIREFITYYNSIPVKYRKLWNFDFEKQFVENNNILPQQETRLLLLIIDIINSTPQKNDIKKIKDLELLSLKTLKKHF